MRSELCRRFVFIRVGVPARDAWLPQQPGLFNFTEEESHALSIKTSTAPKSATDADIMRSPFESRTLDFYMDLRILEDAEGERPARLEAAAYIAGAAEYLRVRAGPAKAIAVLEEIRVAYHWTE